MQIVLSLKDDGIILSRDRIILNEVKVRKWGVLLCALACQQQMGGPHLTFDHLYQQALFSQGRKGHKTPRTVGVEIDNFRRQMKAIGLIILKRKRGSATTYAFDPALCILDEEADFSTRLNHLRGSSDALAFWIKPPLPIHLPWLFSSMRAKVAFAQGQIDIALKHQQAALALTRDPFLNAASYAEVARFAYRADRDLALDMRDQAMDFVESGRMNGAIAQIFAPRIRVSYAFQDDVSAEVQCQQLDVIAANYLSRGIDIAGLCRALNTRDAMRRRAATDSAGLADFQLASALAIATNDPDLVQASLFNILACLEFSTAVTPQDKIKGAEINSWFCQQFNIGRDSAQAELLHAQFHIESGDFDKARTAIKRGVTLIAAGRNATDVAFFFLARANLAYQTTLVAKAAAHMNTITARLTRAERIYTRVGNVIGVRKVAQLKAKLAQSA
ncbi:MAG: hypothetical protein P8P56_07890 [Yoonia sp.]|nr:hypothetical protein [Yoonia sp.]